MKLSEYLLTQMYLNFLSNTYAANAYVNKDIRDLSTDELTKLSRGINAHRMSLFVNYLQKHGFDLRRYHLDINGMDDYLRSSIQNLLDRNESEDASASDLLNCMYSSDDLDNADLSDQDDHKLQEKLENALFGDSNDDDDFKDIIKPFETPSEESSHVVYVDPSKKKTNGNDKDNDLAGRFSWLK